MHDNMNITALLAGLSARNGDRPKYLALADAVEQVFREHELPPGTALPPQRALARALGVTLGTVSRAYAEAATRGLVEASVGRGTFIRVQRPDVDVMPPEAAEGGEAAPDAPHCLPTKRPAADAGNHAVLRAKPALHNLGFIAPFEHLNPSLSQGLRKLTEHNAAMLDGLQSYRRPGGMLRHREAGALWAGRYGLAARPADLLICAGSQHALLTILTSLCAPGDRIAAESLSYPLLRQLARRLRIQIVPVRADAGGMSPDALDSACRGAPPGNRVRAVYLMPSCRNPTLTRMSLRRREEIVEVCRRHDLLIMEDDVFALAHSRDDAPDKGSRLPPLAGLAPERTCFIAATSEVLGGGLRVAYLCPPQHHLEELEKNISYTISMVPPLMAELAARWIRDGTAQHVLEAKRAEAAARCVLARDILDGFELIARRTGFFCWLRLPEPWTGVRFADAARARGVLVAEGEHFAMGHGVPEHGVRIALGGAERREELAAALEALAEILHKGN